MLKITMWNKLEQNLSVLYKYSLEICNIIS